MSLVYPSGSLEKVFDLIHLIHNNNTKAKEVSPLLYQPLLTHSASQTVHTMITDDEKHARFNQTMARLHAREQALAANLDQLDREMQQFRRDLVAFHARRAYVHALIQQHIAEEDALNTGSWTQMDGAPASDVQGVAAGFVERDVSCFAVVTAPATALAAIPVTAATTFHSQDVTATDQHANPVVDDGESLFIPEQARSNEENISPLTSRPNRRSNEQHIDSLTSRPKRRRVTFADDADIIVDGNTIAGSNSERIAQSSDNLSVTAPRSPHESHGF